MTYTNFENFCDSMMRYIKSAYDLSWGKDADKVAEAFISKPIYNLLAQDGSFSNRVFTLLSIPAKTAFSDVASDSYYSDAVAWAVENDVTSGTGNNAFSPEANCTRAQIMTFLWRAYGSATPTCTSNPFADVDENAYYYDAILWAIENGITTGISADAFGPDTSCNRAQAVTFLYRAAGSPTVSGTVGFSDVASDSYYKDAVSWAVANGITSGTGNNQFPPADTCTRAQIVTFLWRNLVG